MDGRTALVVAAWGSRYLIRVQDTDGHVGNFC